VTLLLETN